jgi:hypothetical protein
MTNRSLILLAMSCMVADAYTQHKLSPAEDSGPYFTTPAPSEVFPKGCKTWFDGCNICSANGACTRKFCAKKGATECREWGGGYGDSTGDKTDQQGGDMIGEVSATKALPPPVPGLPKGCKVWFDGCNMCTANGACTMMLCPDGNRPSVCKEWETGHGPQVPPVGDKPAASVVDAFPKGCKTWFDGCNICSANGACTKRYCAKKGASKCREWEGGYVDSTGAKTEQQGDDTNKQCVFPFRYKGVVYDSCTNAGQTDPAIRWCATEVYTGDATENNGQSNHPHIAGDMIKGKWAYCNTSPTKALPPPVPGFPKGCKVWFDGCNTCTANGVCTMMLCPDANRPSVCKEWETGHGPQVPPVVEDECVCEDDEDDEDDKEDSIGRIGRPLTPVSFAGAARRSGRRTARRVNRRQNYYGNGYYGYRRLDDGACDCSHKQSIMEDDNKPHTLKAHSYRSHTHAYSNPRVSPVTYLRRNSGPVTYVHTTHVQSNHAPVTHVHRTGVAYSNIHLGARRNADVSSHTRKLRGK